MGLSSLPAPCEGVLSVVLVNMAISIAIFKEILRSILHLVGIYLPQPSDLDEVPSEPFEFLPFIEELRHRVPTTQFGYLFCGPTVHECSVCLTRFEPDLVVNRIPCGHFFHRRCLGRWLDYWNTMCPLCRTSLIQE
ncbi:zinc finger protein [Cinnamomum micranthum f. kanehirae]|uniref:Zinc finger protein n=1 Tax=Cinnamomum micranthum f. kanehirae TaxID=337451 RepID=A0A3S3R8X7_9MAGN|nr:zinc finger protein [Cinnamomum micranthum f. kanehirae]